MCLYETFAASNYKLLFGNMITQNAYCWKKVKLSHDERSQQITISVLKRNSLYVKFFVQMKNCIDLCGLEKLYYIDENSNIH